MFIIFSLILGILLIYSMILSNDLKKEIRRLQNEILKDKIKRED